LFALFLAVTAPALIMNIPRVVVHRRALLHYVTDNPDLQDAAE